MKACLFHNMLHDHLIVVGIDSDVGDLLFAPSQRCREDTVAAVRGDAVDGAVRGKG